MYKTLFRLALYKSRRLDLSRSAQPEIAMYNLYEARANLSRLVDRVLDGEQIVIARAGRPLVKLVPFECVELPVPGLIRADVLVERPRPPAA